jgi:hypothetical protein
MFQTTALDWPEASVEVIVHLKSVFTPGVRITRDLRGWSRPEPSILVQMVDSKPGGVILTTRLRMEIRAESIDDMTDMLAELRKHMARTPLNVSDCTEAVEWMGARLMPDTDESEMIVVAFDVSFRGAN